MEGGVDFIVNLIIFSILFFGFAVNFWWRESRGRGYKVVGLLSHVQILSNVWHLVYGEQCVSDCEDLVSWILDSYAVTVPITLFIVGVLQVCQVYNFKKTRQKLAVLFFLEAINLIVAIVLWHQEKNSMIFKSYDAFATLLSVQRLLVYLEREEDKSSSSRIPRDLEMRYRY